ncbi:toprim domain-containing protein [Pectobacterium polonicum]|uniref:toprim domain-containing protein n=1 Tax=Pectobacterium polonicum TaxID=2485124 RepID=UPI002361D835|nr:toprim domain-containing protein [Pectobacterium polonicum]MDC9821021.1 toprim domain-containing protein [Pectobacterium polonicum]
MNNELHKEIIKRLIAEFQFKEQEGYLRYGVCPHCHKKELFTSIEKPYVLKCGRENKCGAEIIVNAHYADLFNHWSERYPRTEASPCAAADAYLRESRNLDITRLAGCYTQESFHQKGMGTATVRFSLPSGGYWERLIDQPERFERKANFHGSYAGQWWNHPVQDLSKQKAIWLVEGIFDASSLIQNGIAAVSIMSCNNYPEQALAQLAQSLGERPRPMLVWALDNDPAGNKYTIRHARRSQEAGWTVNAACVPVGRQKRDWNDLHIQGKLTPRDLKEYRYQGDLLLADNAADKALRIAEHTERREFHFEFDSRLYWFKLDLDRHMKAVERIQDGDIRLSEQEVKVKALKEAGAVVEIANCYPVPLYFQRSEPTDEAWYYFQINFPGSTPPVKDMFTSGQLTSASEFKKRLLHVAKGAIYTGNTNQLDRLIRQDLPVIKEVQTQNFIGYNKVWQGWIFNTLAVSGGKVYHLNSEDYFEIGKLSAKSLSHSPVLEINADLSQFKTDWVQDIWTAFGAKGYIALAFWLGSLFAEQIRQQCRSFPFLEIVGEPGTGKSTLIDFLWKLCGRDDYEGFDPTKSTAAARARNFAQVGNLPVVLIEGDRTQDTLRQRAFDFDDLKPLYNGKGMRATGVKSNNNETYEPPFRGSIVIAQNADVGGSPALLERIVHIHTDKSAQTPQTRQAAERLERAKIEQVSGFILKVTQSETAVLDAFNRIYEQAKTELENHPEINHNRIAKNHAQLIAMVETLPLVLPVQADAVLQTRQALVALAAERRQALRTDPPQVQEFWETFEYLDSLDRYGLNHAGKDNREGMVAVNFQHFIQMASEYRVNQSFVISDLKKQLKGGTCFQYMGSKAVRSLPNELYNTGKSQHDLKRPEVVRCWVFKRNELQHS